MSTSQRRSAIPWWAWLLQPWFAATVFIAWYLWQVPPQWQYDSMELYLGCRGLLDWLGGHAQTVGVTRQFPLFQYVSGVAALWAVRRGILSNSNIIYIVWCTCSFLSLAGIIIVFHRATRRLKQPTVGWAMMVVMLSGPFLMYANCTFNELVAAFLILCFTATITGTAPPVLCALLFWLSGITKETVPALLTVIWIGTLWIDRSQHNRRSLLVHSISLAIALIVTVSTNAAFNFLRYGTVWNVNYLQSHELIRSWTWRAQYSLALWLSPNGGIVFFWPTLVIAIVSVMLIALRTSKSKATVVMVAILLGGLTLGLSGWYTPFGWEAWGPRLMLPWMPAAILILLRGYPDACGRFVELCVGGKRAFILSASVVCLSALPHILTAADPRVVGPFFDNDQRFPHGALPPEFDLFHARNLYLAWEKTPPLLLRPITEGVSALQCLEAICFLLALLTLLKRCRLQPNKNVRSASAQASSQCGTPANPGLP